MELVSMAHAQDCDALCKNVVAFAWRLGFEKVCATVVLSDPEGGAAFACVQSAPARPPGGSLRPGAQMPHRWRNRREAPAGEACRTGIALALHLAGGRHFFMVADSSRSLTPDRAELARLAAEVQGFALRAQEFAKRALVPAMPGHGGPPLTARELECLRWTMEGKTAWEVGRILGTSEQTAARHLHHATKKLGCANKHHAVLMGLRLGLIR